MVTVYHCYKSSDIKESISPVFKLFPLDISGVLFSWALHIHKII